MTWLIIVKAVATARLKTCQTYLAFDVNVTWCIELIVACVLPSVPSCPRPDRVAVCLLTDVDGMVM